MPVLSVRDIEKAYGAHTVLKNATFTIRTGERVGLVGRNGAGKSTLVRILAGLEPPDRGEIAVRRGASVQLLEQAPDLPAGRTAREVASEGLHEWTRVRKEYQRVTDALSAGAGDHGALLAEQETLASELERLGGWEREHEVESMLGHLGITAIDGDVGSMSGGERRRVALARLLVARPELAILDEPTNHLDVETIDWLEEHLEKRHKGAVLLVTHDRYLLDRVCTRTLEVELGEVRSYDGGYETFLEAKAERIALEERTEANRQNFLRKELEWLARQPKARTTKQKARIERAETARAAEPVRRGPDAAKLAVEEARTGKTILEMEKLRLDIAGRTLVASLDLYLTQGERIGIVGKNGTGKTTLLRAVIGELAPTSGRLTLGANTKVAYFDQERTGLDDDKTVFENVSEGGAIEIGGERIEPRVYLERFLFDAHKQRQKVSSLSGGERARAALALTLQGKKNLVLLDEPTNDLDVDTLAALEEMLLSFNGSALVVTHDRWFLDRIATSLLVFEEGGRVTHYPGNYDTYRRLKAEAEKDKRAEAVASAPPPSAKPKEAPKRAGLSYKERLELEGLPAKIETTESRIAELEKGLGDPALYASGTNAKETGDTVRAMNEELEKARASLSTLYARWEDLESRASA
ncbi:MAG: ABC-F family ATP-binding cassette domain-containing protein [Polyangiaceae bacterium]